MSLLIAITQGDPAGIGPELIAKLWAHHPEAVQGCVVVGSQAAMARAAQVVGCTAPVPVLECTALTAANLPAWGQVSAAAGMAAAQSVRRAAQGVLRGEFAALVTAPLHKEALHAAAEKSQGQPDGFAKFPGHTELLQALCAEHAGLPLHLAAEQLPVRMMLACSQPGLELRVVLNSIHVSLKDAIAQVTTAQVLQSLKVSHAALQRLGIAQPRIAVAGLNPHAGEGGAFGREELDHILPAVLVARAEGIHASDPLPPDTVFMQARGGQRFDAVLAMYHDQGLIPIKYMGLDHGVNVTLGLPIIRTSPDHGTAFDIAGQGLADETSLLTALLHAKNAAQAKIADDAKK